MTRVGRAAATSAADIILRQGLQFVVIMVLARLLTPAEFGTVALLGLFTGIAAVVVDAGLSTALVQHREIDKVDESTVFWANVILGTCAGIAVAGVGPALSAFFDNEVLTPLAVLFGVTVFVSSLGSLHVARLTRRLEFRPMLVSGLVGTSVSGVVAVVLAAQGHGVWALGFQSLTMAVTSTLILWILCDWRPLPLFSRASAGKLFGFGAFIFLANLSDVVFGRAYTMIAGRMFGVRDVGFYNRAETSQQLPVEMLSSMTSRVLLPRFASSKSPAELRVLISSSLRLLMLVNAPIMLGLAATAEPAIHLVFGEQWDAAVPLLQVLCLAGVLWPVHVVNVQALVAQGHAKLSLKLEVTKKLAGVMLLFLGALWFGLIGLAWGQVAFGALAVVANTYYTRRFVDYGLAAQVRDVLLVLVAGVVSCGAAWATVSLVTAGPALELLAGVIAGAVIYLIIVPLVERDLWRQVSARTWRLRLGGTE